MPLYYLQNILYLFGGMHTRSRIIVQYARNIPVFHGIKPCILDMGSDFLLRLTTTYFVFIHWNAI